MQSNDMGYASQFANTRASGCWQTHEAMAFSALIAIGFALETYGNLQTTGVAHHFHYIEHDGTIMR